MMLPTPSSVAHRRTTRTAVALTVVGLAAAALTGCSGGAGGGTDSQTVTFLSWDTQDTMQPLIDQFEKENPGLTVNASYAPPVTDYVQKLQTQLGSNTGPDVFIITAENKHQLMDGGFAKDLSGESWISNISDAAQQTYSSNGKVYGAAIASWGGGILINKDMLAKVGYTTPPATWDQFLDLGTKLKDSGVTAFYEASDGIPVTLSALLGVENASMDNAMDQDIWDGKTTFADTWTQPLTTWNQLFEKGIEPRSAAGLTGDQVLQAFEQGQVAMIGTGSWALGNIKKAAPNLNLEYLAVPNPKGDLYWCGAVSPGYAINAKAKNPEGADKFVQFLQSKEGVELYQKETQSITTTKDFTPQLDPSLSEMAPAVRDGKIYLPAVNWPDHADVMTSESVALLQQTISGKITPAQFAQGMDDKLASTK
ncbi:ABC transporter substrate-binding protein [Microbacterium sp. SLBN-111]|uniref:ABC transporter substrate-binding protein n=1 Tax=Microbacterium sp. SLBN-111 TaxID=3377733 RepID=UPI003C78646C